MNRTRVLVHCILGLGILVPAIFISWHSRGQSSRLSPVSSEDAYRENNIGVALLEQFKYKEGAEALSSVPYRSTRSSGWRTSTSASRFITYPILPGAEREAKTRAYLRAQRTTALLRSGNDSEDHQA